LYLYLKKKRNVLVFSKDIDENILLYNFFDMNQKFSVIWDANLVAKNPSTIILDNINTFDKFSWKCEESQSISDSILPD